MSELWSESNHRNTVCIFGQSNFVDVIIWEYLESSIHCFPRVLICAVTSWKTLKYMFYLGTMEVVFVSADYHISMGMMLIAELWPYSRHINTSGTFGQLIFGVAIWEPGNLSINFFPKLVIHIVTIRTSLQYFFYLCTVEEALVSANCNLLSGVFLYGGHLGRYSHDYKDVTLGRLIFWVVILEPSFPARHFFTRLVMQT